MTPVFLFLRDRLRFQGLDSACLISSGHALSPLPALQALTGRSIAYFECRFRGGGSIGIIGPGVALNNSGRMHVGWHAPSFGYHSDDGEFYRNDGTTDQNDEGYEHGEYGPSFGEGNAAQGGDVVGCAMDLERGTLSFFKNGEHLGRACAGIDVAAAAPAGYAAPTADDATAGASKFTRNLLLCVMSMYGPMCDVSVWFYVC